VRLPIRNVILQGRVKRLPEAEAKQVPVQLTHRGGGSLAVKPSGNPNELVPQSQQFLVVVEIDDPDRAVTPGTLAKVKIHCRWRTAAWWTWRKINSLFDLGLI
jgi:putative peptide zinc metalloprotease protein